MASYNTVSDATNTAVRAYLTKIGEHYLGRHFDTTSGQAKLDWEEIRDVVFCSKCAYCDQHLPLEKEHLLMFNSEQFGLHHPGNIVPVCKPCNKRKKGTNKKYLHWEEHLHEICKDRNELHLFQSRRDKIYNHMNTSKFRYPSISLEEKALIVSTAKILSEKINEEFTKSLESFPGK